MTSEKMRFSMTSSVAMTTALVVALMCCQAASFHAPHKGTDRFRSNPLSDDVRDRSLEEVYSDWEGRDDEEESLEEDDYYPNWPAPAVSDRKPVWVEQKLGSAAASAKQQKPPKAAASKTTPAPQPPPGVPPAPGGPPPPGGPPLPKGADKTGETKGGKNATAPAPPQSPDQPILPVPIPGSPILGPAVADIPPGGGKAPWPPSNTGQPPGGQGDADRGPLGSAESNSPSSLKDVGEVLKALRKLAVAKKKLKPSGLGPGDFLGDETRDLTDLKATRKSPALGKDDSSQDEGEGEEPSLSTGRGEETSGGKQLSSKDVALIRKNNDLIKEVLRTVDELKTGLLNSDKVENSPDKGSRSAMHGHKKSHTESQEMSTRQREDVGENEGHRKKFHHSKEQKEPESNSDWTKNTNMKESQNHQFESKKGHKHNNDVKQSQETGHQQTSKQGNTFGDNKRHGNHHHKGHTKIGRQDSRKDDTHHTQEGWEDYEEDKEDDRSDERDQEATTDDDDDESDDDDDDTTDTEDW